MNDDSPFPGKHWNSWTLQEWNDRLLDHLFRSSEEQSSPVVILLATAEQLAHVTGDTKANAEEVRSAFVNSVTTGIRRLSSLLDHASDYFEWPHPPSWDSSPSFVAHLLLTCVAASESSDELREENSFVSRLRELTRNQLPEPSLKQLPRLWENLRDWLADHRVENYRSLVLPNPGSFSRIGYTVKLAFPDRRDQRLLSELLDAAGLGGNEPPIGRVISLIASEKNRFRHSFQVAFDEFRQLLSETRNGSSTQLVEHRFWAAIREASLRGRGQSKYSANGCHLTLLGTEEDDQVVLFVVADRETQEGDTGFAPLPLAYGRWHFALVPKGTIKPDALQFAKVVSDLFTKRLNFPKLSSLIDQGLLPFAVGDHGLLELAGQDQFNEVAVALVKEEMVSDLLRLIGNPTASARKSVYDGWVQISKPKLRILPTTELEGSPLSRTWILHESIQPPSIRISGGVHADDGWLGVHEVLPEVVVRDASSVVLEGADKVVPLVKALGNNWSLPPTDLAGDFVLVACINGIDFRRKIRFNVAPASEAFKGASDPESWIIEEINGTGTLSSTLPVLAETQEKDWTVFCERAAYLGPDVGVFVSGLAGSAWRITHFAGKFVGSSGDIRGSNAYPSQTVTNPNARRRWRKMLFESIPCPSDPDFDVARRLVKAEASSHSQLPKLESEVSVPNIIPWKLPTASKAAERLARVVAGRAVSRSGIDWREWESLVMRVLGVESGLVEQVTRAWMEAGFIDVASFARWWHRAVFVRRPRLVAFNIGTKVGASLSGLALPRTIGDLRKAAERNGILIEDRFSISSFVPSTISFRAPSARALQELASACRLELYWLDPGVIEYALSSRHDGTSTPPEFYEHSTNWQRWSLSKSAEPTVIVKHFMRPDRPSYWTVSCGGKQLWFYDLNVTRLWGSALLEECPVIGTADGALEVKHAFLPLVIARAVSVLGSGLSGPTDGGPYRYPIGIPHLSEAVLRTLSRNFDPSLLAENQQEK